MSLADMGDEQFQKEIVSIFRDESLRYLARMTEILEEMCRSDSRDVEASFEELHRIAHSIKGSAGLLDYADTAACAKSLESLFREVAEGTLSWNAELADAVAGAVEALNEHVSTGFAQNDPNGGLFEAARRLDLVVSSLKSRR